MYCTKCGKAQLDEAAFCGDCGFPLQSKRKNTQKGGKAPIIAIAAIAVLAIGVIVAFVLFSSFASSANAYGTSISNTVRGATQLAKTGNTLYYIPINLSYDAYSGSADTIRKVGIDGSGDTEVYASSISNETDVCYISGLYIVGDRLYFKKDTFDAGAYIRTASVVVSTRLDGTDERVELDLGEVPSADKCQIFNGEVFFTRNSAIYAKPLDSEETRRITILGEEYASWIVADGYVYVTEDDGDYSKVRRVSLQDGSEERLYSCRDGYVGHLTPHNGLLYFLQTELTDAETIYELMRLDPETGKCTTLYRIAGGESHISSWTLCDNAIYVTVSRAEQPQELYEVALDGSNDKLLMAYDGSWAGNISSTRNLGASDEATLSPLYTCDNQLFFWPYDFASINRLNAEDPNAPAYVSLCTLDSSKSSIVPITVAEREGQTPFKDAQ